MLSFQGWRIGSTGRVLAYQVQNPVLSKNNKTKQNKSQIKCQVFNKKNYKTYEERKCFLSSDAEERKHSTETISKKTPILDYLESPDTRLPRQTFCFFEYFRGGVSLQILQ
jgi:hypothetical protein